MPQRGCPQGPSLLAWCALEAPLACKGDAHKAACLLVGDRHGGWVPPLPCQVLALPCCRYHPTMLCAKPIRLCQIVQASSLSAHRCQMPTRRSPPQHYEPQPQPSPLHNPRQLSGCGPACGWTCSGAGGPSSSRAKRRPAHLPWCTPRYHPSPHHPWSWIRGYTASTCAMCTVEDGIESMRNYCSQWKGPDKVLAQTLGYPAQP